MPILVYLSNLGMGGGGAPAPQPSISGGGGAGHPVGIYYQGKRRKLSLREQPNKHLDHILDKVVSEYYGDILASDAPKTVKREAAKLVRPYVEVRKQKLPEPEKVDWGAFERDIAAVKSLIQIWLQIREEDELLILYMMTMH